MNTKAYVSSQKLTYVEPLMSYIHFGIYGMKGREKGELLKMEVMGTGEVRVTKITSGVAYLIY